MIKKVSTIDDDGVIIQTKDFRYTIFDDDKGYLFRNKAHYIKGYQGIKLSEIVQNRSDYANMHLLAENLYKDTNMIYVYRNKKYYPADFDDICLMLDMCERRVKEFISRMTDLGIMAKVVVNTHETVQVQYHVNPLYFNTSKYISPSLYMLFRKQLDEYLPQWVIRRFNE